MIYVIIIIEINTVFSQDNFINYLAGIAQLVEQWTFI